jgi:tetratricopeptide (TPR) repeat protein
VAALAGTSKEVLQAGRQLGELPSLSARPGAGGATPAAPAFEQLMMRGEERLKDGKYLEAADAYQQAITAQPNNALAVLGRGHAELAAGMYQSAASDLQFVFTKKPELVSVKYALGNYLPLDRQVFLMNDLLKLSRGQDTGNMGSFLLCYLCYQTGRGAELKAELDRWAARPWKNDWQTVAEKAWR